MAIGSRLNFVPRHGRSSRMKATNNALGAFGYYLTDDLALITNFYVYFMVISMGCIGGTQ